MNQAPADAAAFMRTFTDQYVRQNDRRVLFFPPAVSLHIVVQGIRERGDLEAGVQNIHWEDKGAFTGETSGPLARAAGAKHVLVGHSERRHVFGETEEETAKKVAAAFRAGLTPTICVGETLAQREAGETLAVVRRQLRAAVAGIDAGVVATSIVAYEPVWAIGTGRNATAAQAQDAHAHVRGRLRQWFGAETAEKTRILYGGSVKPDNIAELLREADVDGALVGGASLDVKSFGEIVTKSRRAVI